MAKALFGVTADPRTLSLLEEVRSLRQRVAELESALDRAEHALEDGDRIVDLDHDEVSVLERSGSVPA